MENYDKNELLIKEIIDNHKEVKWKHQFFLGNNITTCPQNQYFNSSANCINKWNRILNLVGKDFFYDKDVLDIGCSEGYFAFEAANIARKVIGVDLDPITIERANLIKRLKNKNNCNFFCKDCNDLSKKKFNVAFALGLLHRLENPIGFLKSITDISDEIIIEYKCFKSSKPLAYYAGGNYKVNKFSKFYFAFSISCLENALKNFGFEIIKKEKLKFFSKLKFPRHMVYAKRKT